MCGISGVYLINNNIELFNKLVVKILEYQNRRGPDVNNHVSINNVILGHNRLSIIDLSSSGNQPMESDKGIITFNGEIYNYIELRSRLIKNGITFNSYSDSEVLLKCIDNLGFMKTLSMINGMFAFGYYDKIKKELFLVRDRIGLKPLYYTIINKNLIFASNLGALIKSIKEVLEETLYLNRNSLYKYLLLGGCFEGETFIKDVFKLESGTFLKISRSSFIKKKYWEPKPNNMEITDLIKDSINIRKRADVPVSILFSGGIDSSVIGYYCKGYKGIHLCTDETEYAEQISNKLFIDLIKIEEDNISTEEMEQMMSDYINFSGEPGLSAVIPMIVFKNMKKYSTVGLSGNGGDELFYGYDRTPISSSKLSRKNRSRLYPKNVNYTYQDYQLLHIFRHPKNFTVHGIHNFSYDELKKYVLFKSNLSYFKDKESIYRWLELNNYVKNDLNPTLDFASMYYSLEIRVPFLDHRLIERSLTLGSKYHIYNEGTFPNNRKKILKSILADKLDESLYNRTKKGFCLPKRLTSHYNNIGSNAIEKLKRRKILDSVNFKYGNVGRDTIYFNRSCVSLEKWMQLYVDTNYVFDKLYDKEMNKVINEYTKTKQYIYYFELKPYNCYKMSICLSNMDCPNDIEININDDNHDITNLFITDCQLVNNYYVSYFITSTNKNIRVTIHNHSIESNQSLFINDIDIDLNYNYKELYHLVLFGNFLSNDKYLYNYKKITAPNSKIITYGSIAYDNFTLFNSTKHGLNSYKITSKVNKNKCGFINDKCKLDPKKYYLCFIASYAINQRTKSYMYISNYKRNILWDTNSYEYMVKDTMGFVSNVIQGDTIKYGILQNDLYMDKLQSFNIAKICHFEITDYQLYHKNPNKQFDVIVLIAFTGRYKILEENVRLLNNQTYNDIGIILIGSTNEDKQFVIDMNNKYKNVYYLICTNTPACHLRPHGLLVQIR
jgi:asparagine synthase (glutamine-hydrolysing)